MSTSKVVELVDQLEDNIDDLEEILQPLLSQSLSESTKKLPLLDRAKLHVTVVYAIESLLFSYLKINGVDAREHPIFRELGRVKQYFEKVKESENGPAKAQPRDMALDKQAALRMIKHSLAANSKIDLEKAEADARQKILAKRKLKLLEDSMKEKAATKDGPTKTDVEMTSVEEQEIADLVASAAELIAAAGPASGSDQSPDSDAVPASTSIATTVNGETQSNAPETESTRSKKKKNKKRKQSDVEQSNNEAQDEAITKRTKGEKRRAKKDRKREREAAAATAATDTSIDQVEMDAAG